MSRPETDVLVVGAGHNGLVCADDMSQASRQAETQGFSSVPIIEVMISSVVDDSLAPKGADVAGLLCQQFRPDADWDRLKPRALEAIFDAVQSYYRNFR